MPVSATDMPIIRVELESMRHSILHAFTTKHYELEATLRTALDKVLTPEFISHTIESEALRVLEARMRDEVQSYFNHGDGRRLISEAVKRRLEDEIARGNVKI